MKIEHTFEYETPSMGVISVSLQYIAKHFKFIASSEDGHDAIDYAFQQRKLAYKDFKTVLAFDDVVIQRFGLFFLICEAGIYELYCDEAHTRYIKNIGAKSLSFSVVPNGYGARFNLEQDGLESNLRMKEVWGFDVAIGKSETAFALIGSEEGKMLIMGQWKDNHDDVACKALEEYDREAEEAEVKFGKGFGFSRLMKEKALKYGTTIEAMKEHWRCQIKFKE